MKKRLFDYDFFVIGAGSGGTRAARLAAQSGAKTAIAENKEFGGTCVNVGCVPKKLFYYASHFSQEFANAKSFGWDVSTPKHHWKKLISSKNKEIKRLNTIYSNILEKNGVTVYPGEASFLTENTLQIGEKQVSAKNILIATGGLPQLPKIQGNYNKKSVITSNEVFYLEEIPQKIVIVGGGYIAIEFAGIFNSLGVDTTLIVRSQLLREFDRETVQFLQQEITKQNIQIITGATVSEVHSTNKHQEIRLSNGKILQTDILMYATGRQPNTKKLGLENVSLAVTKNGAICVDENYRTEKPHIYAIGDVIDKVSLTPVAIKQAVVLINNLFYNKKMKINYDNIATAIFSQPNLATVGQTEEEARSKTQVEIFKTDFIPMKFSLSSITERSFMKIIVEKDTDKILGVHIVTPEAGEIMQGIAVALQAGATKSIFDSTIAIHPTTAEELVTLT